MIKNVFSILLFVIFLMPLTLLASNVDKGAVIGGAIGGGTGAAVGSAVGGKEGAVIGAAVGAAVGAYVGAENDDVHHHDSKRHDNGLHLGHYKNKHKQKHKYK